jgi:hypothetical protein
MTRSDPNFRPVEPLLRFCRFAVLSLLCTKTFQINRLFFSLIFFLSQKPQVGLWDVCGRGKSKHASIQESAQDQSIRSDKYKMIQESSARNKHGARRRRKHFHERK